MTSVKTIFSAFRAAFPVTLPVLAGYWLLGATYGLYMRSLGFSPWYPILMAWLVYGGSLEFVAASLLLAPFAPVTTFCLAFVIQARHLFFGIAMLDRFRGLGWKKPYLIFGMSDETFALEFSQKAPEGADPAWFMTAITFLDRMYWVGGAATGALFGGLLTFNLKGLPFVMTAMFVVIFLDRFLQEKNHVPAVIGGAASVASLLLFGKENFMIPAMVAIVCLLALFRRPIEGKGGLGE